MASPDEPAARAAVLMTIMPAKPPMMIPKDNPAPAWRTGVTLAVLLSVACALAALILRPGRASLWPAGEWPAGARGAVGLDEPPRR